MQRIFIPIIGLLCVMYACTNDLTTIGQEIIGSNSYIAELSIPVVNTATIKIDSFVTSSGLNSSTLINKLVIGRYKDIYSGETEATPCFQILPDKVPSIPNYAILDSVTFNFRYAGNMWGDTLYDKFKLQKYDLYQLEELPEIDYDVNTLFYNTKAVNIAEKPIATIAFYPLVENMRHAYFKVDQAVGYDLFERMMYRRDYDDDIYNGEVMDHMSYYSFLTYFKGLAIVADKENDCMMTIHALSDSLYLEFHYTIGEDENSLKFPLGQRDLQYNRIINKPIKKLESLEKTVENEVEFEEVEFALTQGMAGYMTKLTLPDAPGLNRYQTIIKAQLEIKPEFYPYNPIANPKIIWVYTTNDVNEVTGPLINSGTEDWVTGKLIEDHADINKTRYIFDMTDYYQRVSTSSFPAPERQRVLLSVPNDGFSSDGVSFDQMIVRETPILRVYYANYN